MMVQTKEQIFALINQYQPRLDDLGVCRVGLFGSFLKKQQTQQSDVDVLVEFESGQKTFDNFMHLSFFLEEFFGRKVDLVTPESLSPYIKPRILAEVEYVSFHS